MKNIYVLFLGFFLQAHFVFGAESDVSSNDSKLSQPAIEEQTACTLRISITGAHYLAEVEAILKREDNHMHTIQCVIAKVTQYLWDIYSGLDDDIAPMKFFTVPGNPFNFLFMGMVTSNFSSDTESLCVASKVLLEGNPVALDSDLENGQTYSILIDLNKYKASIGIEIAENHNITLAALEHLARQNSSKERDS